MGVIFGLSAQHKIMASTAAIVMIAHAAPAMAQTRTFDVPMQSATSGIPAFAKQAGTQIIASGKTVRSKRTNTVKGYYTVEQGLRLLLQGTGLEASGIDSRTGVITIRPSAPKARVAPSIEEGRAGGAVIDDQTIIVTAQKREERLQEVPISIAVLGGELLDRSSDSVIDQLERVPGVAVGNTANGAKQLTVRGVSSTGEWFAGTSAVGYYLDSVPFGFVRQGFVPDSNAYDLERVEILRGPQGTLYGVSALNGVVRVLTAEPDLDDFVLKTRALVSSTKNGGEGYRGDGAISVPIVSGKLAARAAVSYDSSPGWIDGPTGKDVNYDDNLTARIKLKAAPTEDFSVTAMLWHSETDAGPGALSARDRTSIQQVPESSSADYDIYALRAELDLGAVSIVSSTSYMDYESRSLISFAPDSTDFLESLFTSKNFSQEIALNSNSDGRLKWSVGAIYRDVTDLVYQEVSIPFPPLGYNDFSKSFAVFGEISYDINEYLKISGGGRYFKDNNKVHQTENPFDQSAELIKKSEKFDRFSPRFVLNWIPSSSLSVYLSYGEGFRSGFSQSPTILGVEPNFPGVGPDHLTNYELGAKGSLFDGLLGFEGAIFFMDWQGVQQNVEVFVPQLGGTLNALINGESASGLGADLMLTVKPVNGMTLGATYSWNALEFDADVFTIVNGLPKLLTPKGSRLFNSPKDSASAFVDYQFPAGDLDVNVSGSVNYTAPREIAGATSVKSSDPIWMARASIGVSSKEDGWNVSLFVENLTDFKGAVSASSPGQDVADTEFRARPRTIGIQVGFEL